MAAPGTAVESPRSLNQYMTPLWAAEALVEHYFPGLTSSDLVLEPSCGDGAFLAALPSDVPALGVEIDPCLAERARLRTGRSVVTGDIATASIDASPTVAISNPPFVATAIEAMLSRCVELMPRDGVAGFLLPAYALQTPSRVLRYAEHWGIHAEMVPRTLFPGLPRPLVFAIFDRSRPGALVGLGLYAQADQV